MRSNPNESQDVILLSVDLTGLNGSEIIYDDGSSDTSDSTSGAGEKYLVKNKL